MNDVKLPKGTKITTTKKICRNPPFFAGVCQKVTHSYKESGATIAIDPPQKMYF